MFRNRHISYAAIISLVGLLSIICVVFFYLYHISELSRNTELEQIQVAKTHIGSIYTQATNTLPPGLQISRDFMIGSIQKLAPDINFSQSLPINNQEAYSAQEDENTIQLIGPQNDLLQISSTASIDSNANSDRKDNIPTRNRKALDFIENIPNIIDSEAGLWVTSVINNAINDMDTGEVNIHKSTTFHNRKYTLSIEYTSILKFISLTIDSENVSQ